MEPVEGERPRHPSGGAAPRLANSRSARRGPRHPAREGSPSPLARVPVPRDDPGQRNQAGVVSCSTAARRLWIRPTRTGSAYKERRARFVGRCVLPPPADVTDMSDIAHTQHLKLASTSDTTVEHPRRLRVQMVSLGCSNLLTAEGDGAGPVRVSTGAERPRQNDGTDGAGSWPAQNSTGWCRPKLSLGRVSGPPKAPDTVSECRTAVPIRKMLNQRTTVADMLCTLLKPAPGTHPGDRRKSFPILYLSEAQERAMSTLRKVGALRATSVPRYSLAPKESGT